jgi:hypothetical protein
VNDALLHCGLGKVVVLNLSLRYVFFFFFRCLWWALNCVFVQASHEGTAPRTGSRTGHQMHRMLESMKELMQEGAGAGFGMQKRAGQTQSERAQMRQPEHRARKHGDTALVNDEDNDAMEGIQTGRPTQMDCGYA